MRAPVEGKEAVVQAVVQTVVQAAASRPRRRRLMLEGAMLAHPPRHPAETGDPCCAPPRRDDLIARLSAAVRLVLPVPVASYHVTRVIVRSARQAATPGPNRQRRAPTRCRSGAAFFESREWVGDLLPKNSNSKNGRAMPIYH